MKPYIFFRKEGWYIVEYPSNAKAREGAETNQGTLKVECAITNKTIWKAKK